MTIYEHLSVLISIVIGLGLTHLLGNVHELVQARERVRLHWMPITWAALVFVGLVQWWWSSFQFQDHQQWTFFWFLFVLMRPVLSYLSAAFVLPRVEAGESYDLVEYYYRTRGWLFSLLAGGQVLDGVRRMLEGQPAADVAVWSNFVSAALVGSLALTDDDRYHIFITLLTVGLFILFLVQAALTIG